MEIGQIEANDQFKILKADIASGERMPVHYATSDAFIIVARGRALLIFADTEVNLAPGTTFLIPARKPHSVEIMEDFGAYIVLKAEGTIEFAKHLTEHLKGSHVSC